jgi:NosR/NirI family nitrous oxide reductase transcriptional regulator
MSRLCLCVGGNSILPARVVRLMIGLAFALIAFPVVAEQRFPPPDFESGHQLPATLTPLPRAILLQYLDVAVLAASLGMATWLVYKKRSRKALIGLSLFSLIYFGFWRKGCVCSIGSVQNVALALFERNYALPLGVTAFFVLPLVFALFAGRAFCSAVCPHGALQDLVLLKPTKVAPWLEHALGIIPYVYLGAAMLLAATGSTFLVCQYDPFVPIFRLNGRALMVIAGVALLVLGIFVGRPYCRFLCPYGALLKIAGTLSKWRVRTTPGNCTQCRLCESSCPFGAMREPELTRVGAPALREDRRRLGILLACLPLIIAGMAWAGSQFAGPASRLNPTVLLAEELGRNTGEAAAAAPVAAKELALQRARQAPAELMEQAARIRKRFAIGGWVFGGWVGLVIGIKLISLSLRTARTDYEPDRGNCVACARCFEHCPNELARVGKGPTTCAKGCAALAEEPSS